MGMRAATASVSRVRRPVFRACRVHLGYGLEDLSNLDFFTQREIVAPQKAHGPCGKPMPSTVREQVRGSLGEWNIARVRNAPRIELPLHDARAIEGVWADVHREALLMVCGGAAAKVFGL